MRNASPAFVRKICVIAGLLSILVMAPPLLWDLHTGRTTVYKGRGKGSVSYTRADNPVAFRAAVRRYASWGATWSFGLMLFGQCVVWLNRLPGSPKTWD